MGSSHTRDPNIGIFVECNKPYYVAGEYVEGCVYLDVKDTSKYSNVTIYLEGLQYVYWFEYIKRNGRRRRKIYKNKYESYKGFFLLKDFKGTVPKGQYTLPFAFLLPASMCGSFYISPENFIKYTLKAELVHMTEQNKNQFYAMPMSILEPPRMPLGQALISKETNAQCCGCCCSYGTTLVSMTSERNFVVNGDNLTVKGFVDNRKGTEDIKTCKIMLKQCRIKISSKGRVQRFVDKEWAFYGINEPIPKASMKQFQVTNKIPTDIVQSTAIGRVTAIYYILHFTTEFGCCASTPDAVLHLILHSKTPIVLKKVQMPKPQIWNPVVLPTVVNENMKPYILNPLQKIPFHNRPGNTVVAKQPQMMMEMNNGYPPKNNYYNGKEEYNQTLENMHETTENNLNTFQNQPNNTNYIPNVNQFNNYNPVFYDQQIYNAYAQNQEDEGNESD